MPNTTEGTRSRPTVGLQEAVRAADECFDTSAVAVEWLTSPKRILGGVLPIEHACTHEGAVEVIDLLGRISHGVFSIGGHHG